MEGVTDSKKEDICPKPFPFVFKSELRGFGFKTSNLIASAVSMILS
jgi:hypothetical protein